MNGRVKSLKRKEEKILTPREHHKGYLQVHLRVEGKDKTIKIHRLAAEAFVPNLYNLPQVNHKDGNKKNNKAENLEWVSNSSNQKHAYKNGLRHFKNVFRDNKGRFIKYKDAQ